MRSRKADKHLRARLSRRRSKRSRMTFQGSSQMICRRMALMDPWDLASRTISILLSVSDDKTILGARGMVMLTRDAPRRLLRRMEQYWCSNAASAPFWRCERCLLQSHFYERTQPVSVQRGRRLLSADRSDKTQFPLADRSYSHEDSIQRQEASDFSRLECFPHISFNGCCSSD